MADLGDGPGERAPPPPFFWTKLRHEERKKVFWRPPNPPPPYLPVSLSKDLDDSPPPPLILWSGCGTGDGMKKHVTLLERANSSFKLLCWILRNI